MLLGSSVPVGGIMMLQMLFPLVASFSLKKTLSPRARIEWRSLLKVPRFINCPCTVVHSLMDAMPNKLHSSACVDAFRDFTPR